MSTIRELGPEETHLAYLAMRELRPNLDSLQMFVSRVNHDQRPEGYRLVAAFDQEDEEDDGAGENDESEEWGAAAAVVGFRLSHHLSRGSCLYVDDLITREAHRRRGHGSRLMQWVLSEARRLRCDELHLDSWPHRHDAHRLYLNQCMHISAFHFRRVLR